MKKSYLTKTLIAITLIAVMCFSVVSFAGCNAGCYINAPETLEAELGVYVVPDYDVVNSNGMIMSGFDVRLKSVTDANGQKVEFDQNSVTITEKGVYKFVYGARGVKDATVNIDFADRTAPTVDFNANNLPSFFITGNSYRIPAYTLSGDYVREKCSVKVVHVADDKKETEVEIKSNRFKVTETSGSYEIRIHVEDAVGNVRDYAFARPVDGPETIKENTIIYFDEPFGERQVYCLESGYTGQYVSNEVLGDKAREGDNGAYKVTFKGTETSNNEGYISLKTPAILDVNGYTELEMYVYNDSDNDAIFGATWWNDTKIKKGEWTRISFSVDNWGHCTWADNSNKIVSTSDVSNMGLRFIFAYDHQTLPSGTFYLSPLRGVPRIPAEVTAGEDVTLDKNSYSIGSVVNLTAAEKTGKVVDCFLVDGKPIVGDSFVVTEAQHAVTVKYVDELTFGTMTWATGFHYPVPNNHWMTANYMGVTYVGDSDKWVISTDVIGGYNENTGGQTMNLTWMIGNIESIELQLNRESGVIKWYFAGGDNWNTPVANLSNAQFNKLKNASEQAPVNVTVMRNGDLLLITIDGEFVGRNEINNGLSSNAFGIGYRKEGADKPDTVLLANTKAVMGEERTELYYATLNAAVDKENDDVSTDKESYRLGDVVTLTAKEAGDGQVFGYFTLDGEKIIGNSFVVTKRSHTVGAVYVTLSDITYENGVTAAEGKLVGVGTNLTLSHGEAPEQGKVFDHYLVDGQTKVYGNVFTVTETEHTISAVWVDAAEFTWGGADERYTCDKIMGSDASVWQDRGFVGHVFGSSEYWAVKVDVKHTAEWNSFEFVQGTKQSIRIRFHQGNYFGIIVITDNGSEWAPDGHSEFVHAYPNQNPDMVAKLLAGTTITCVRYGDTITMYADNIPFFTTDYAVDHTGNWFGLGHVDRPDGKLPEMTNVQFIMGKDKVDAHLETLNAIFTKTDVTTDKDEYRIGDTVTLTAASAPEGQKFSHFEVDDVRISGNTFVVTKSTHKLVAVYSEISTIELGAGVSTADGETEYARGATVTLAYDKASLNGKLFNYFTIDGKRIVGNTFVTTAANHVVAIVTADTVDGLTWVDSTEAEEKNASFNWSAYKFKGVSVGISDCWVMEVSASKFDTLGGDWYSLDLLVGSNATLQIRLHSAGNALIQAMGSNLSDGGELVKLDASVIDACKAATEQNPVKFTCIRNDKTFYVLFNGVLVLKTNFDFKAADNAFGVGGTDCGEWLTNHPTYTYRYRTGEEIAASKTISKVTGTNVTLDKADGSYTLGDTVTLGHGEAPVGQKFSHFTVDGVKIDGNTFAIIKSAHNVAAVYADISAIELGAGITTSDGATEYARGATVKLKVNGEASSGKFFDGFKVDGVQILGDTFVTTAATHSIEAVWVDAENFTFGTATEGNANTTLMGEDGEYWQSKNFDGYVFGQAEYWMVNVDVKQDSGWQSFEFIQGSTQSIRLRFHDGNYFGIILMIDNAEKTPSSEFVNAYPNQNAAMVTKMKAGTTITCIRYNDVITMYIDDVPFFSTNYTIDHTGNWFGVGYVSGENASKVEMSNAEFAMGKDKIDAYREMKQFVGTQVNDISSATAKDSSAVEYVASPHEFSDEMKNDANLKTDNVLKVTAASSDVALNMSTNYSTYSCYFTEIYYYVYIESDSAVTNVGAGAYWKDDDVLQANTWVKVTLDSTQIAELSGGANSDLSGITLRIYSKTWMTEEGFTDINGMTFYVTSLYGVPKV